MSKITDARDLAKTRGELKFLSPTPCKNGHKSYRLTSNMTCCECSRQYIKLYRVVNMHKWGAYREKNRKVIAERACEYRKIRREEINKRGVARRREKRQTDPLFAMKHRLRSRMAEAYHGNLKPEATRTLIGCTFEEFYRHIENKFSIGMSWDNRNQWHIDHIRPISSFDITDKEQARLAFHYTNCQPLWAKDNLKKGAAIFISSIVEAPGFVDMVNAEG